MGEQRKSVVGTTDLDGQDFVGFDEDLPIWQRIERFLGERAPAPEMKPV